MRVTKTMKEVIDRKLTEKRLAANEAESMEYETTRKKCISEVEAIIVVARANVEEVLQKYGMDMTCKRYHDTRRSADEIVQFNSGYICNADTNTALNESGSKRFRQQQEAMQEIIFDAEAGGDKDSLLAAIAAVEF